MPDTKFSLVSISFNNKEIGRLFVNNDGKLEFEGEAEESAKVFFDIHLKQLCEEHIELIIDKKQHPLFYWKETCNA